MVVYLLPTSPQNKDTNVSCTLRRGVAGVTSVIGRRSAGDFWGAAVINLHLARRTRTVGGGRLFGP